MRHLNCNSKLIDGVCYYCGYADSSHTPLSFIASAIPIVKNKPNRTPVKSSVKRQVFFRDGYKCLKCGVADNLTYDHILPLSKGGKTTVANGQTLCFKCNVDKSDTIQDYRQWQ